MHVLEEHRLAIAQLSGDPSLIDVVRIANRLTKSEVEVVLFDEHRAIVVAALGRSVLQPRSLRASEEALVEENSRHSITSRFSSFVMLSPDGRPMGAVTIPNDGNDFDIEVMHGLARLCSTRAAELFADSQENTTADVILESLRDAVVVVDSELVITYANRSISTQLGYNPSEIVGMGVADLVHPEDVDAAFTALVKLSGSDEVYRHVVRVKNVRDEYKFVEITGRDMSADPRVGGTILSLRDGNHETELADSLSRNERLSQAIVEQLHDGIVATDALGVLLVVNDSARHMLGLHASIPAVALELDDMNFLDHMGHLLQGQNHPVREILAGHELRNVEMSTIAASQYLDLKVSGRPVLDTEGEPIGTVLGIQDVTGERKAERKFRQLSFHDQLTGLPNRRKMHEQLHTYAAQEPALLITACLIDLDNFKIINDTHGHRVGDEVLRAATNKVKLDPDQPGLTVRLGGDEFVVLLPGLDSKQALDLANDFLRDLRQPIEIGDKTFTLTASIGIAQALGHELDSGDLLRHADLALYSAKSKGRNQAELFTAELAQAAKVADRQRETLRRALSEDALEMFFQPLVDSTTNELVGVESLARCRNRDGSLISPAGFVDAAASTGLVWELDSKAFELSCMAAAAISVTAPQLGVACNFSGLSILQPDFVDTVEATIDRHNIDPATMCIEITESAAFDAGPTATAALMRLHERGIRLALDDFGTGYSSLSHIRDLPLSTVKVDRSFVSRLELGSADHSIAKAIVALAADLDLTVVAEGVETQSQLDIARSMGFNVIQGWFYSQAKPLADILEMLAQQGEGPHSVPESWGIHS